ncbi:MAG: SRPBCC domain-containing protein [Chlorobium sp.]|uniref:SRPBCC domain-containing protein n=1 Tax=Chlorobium sp. TaxID=1095 RepID=UPI002F3EB82E
MVEVQTGITLDAAPGAVWKVLADAAAYPEWNTMITSLDGELREGCPIRIRVRLRFLPAIRLPFVVTAVHPEKRLCWVLTFPAGLLRVEHCFCISGDRTGGVRFDNIERFSGIIGVLAGSVMRRMFRSDYERMNKAITQRVHMEASKRESLENSGQLRKTR